MSLDMKALKEAAEKATPGPWNVDPMHCVYAGNPENGTRQDVADNAWHNAPFIALANPSTILSLIERCETMEAVLIDIKGFLQRSGYDTRLVREALSKADATS